MQYENVFEPQLIVSEFQVPSSAPPPPPVRNTSIRNGASSSCSEIESRFSDCFHSVHEFPTPQPFQRVFKVYNSRNGKLKKRIYLYLSSQHRNSAYECVLLTTKSKPVQIIVQC